MTKSSRISNASPPIYEETDYSLTLSNIQYSDVTQLQDFISNLPKHPNVLSPLRVDIISKQRVCLHYKVSKRGMTLRNWVKQQQQAGHNIRMTFTNVNTRFAHKITPYDIILPLIDGYEFMLNNNLLLNQSSINPDFIWVDYDQHEHGKLVIFAINTLETLAVDYCGTIDTDKNYWSPELLGKYNHFKFYATDSEHDQLFDSNHGHVVIRQQQTMGGLKRYNTRPSTLSCVYSLGLVFYFIVAKHDPFPEQRIHVFDRPEIDVIKYSINPVFAKRIWTATEPQLNDRPTMNDWKESIQRDLNASKHRLCILL
jgi:hypothetical protein